MEFQITNTSYFVKEINEIEIYSDRFSKRCKWIIERMNKYSNESFDRVVQLSIVWYNIVYLRCNYSKEIHKLLDLDTNVYQISSTEYYNKIHQSNLDGYSPEKQAVQNEEIPFKHSTISSTSR